MVISKRQTKRLSAIWAILSVCASLLVRSCAQTQKNKPVNAGKNGMSNEKEITHLEKTLDRRRRWLWRWRRWWRQRWRSSDENVDWKLAQTAEDQNEKWIQLYFKMNWIEIDLVCLTVVLLVHAYRLPTLMSINEYFLCVWSKNAFFFFECWSHLIAGMSQTCDLIFVYCFSHQCEEREFNAKTVLRQSRA